MRWKERRHAAPRVTATGKRDVAEMTNSAVVGQASVKDLIVKRPQGAASPDVDALAPLTAIAAGQWRALAERAVEPNGY